MANLIFSGDIAVTEALKAFNRGTKTKGLSVGRGHATPHVPVETAKCWWLLKIEPNAWAGGKGSCAVGLR